MASESAVLQQPGTKQQWWVKTEEVETGLLPICPGGMHIFSEGRRKAEPDIYIPFTSHGYSRESATTCELLQRKLRQNEPG